MPDPPENWEWSVEVVEQYDDWLGKKTRLLKVSLTDTTWEKAGWWDFTRRPHLWRTDEIGPDPEANAANAVKIARWVYDRWFELHGQVSVNGLKGAVLGRGVVGG